MDKYDLIQGLRKKLDEVQSYVTAGRPMEASLASNFRMTLDEARIKLNMLESTLEEEDDDLDR